MRKDNSGPLDPRVAKAQRYHPMRAARTGVPVLGLKLANTFGVNWSDTFDVSGLFRRNPTFTWKCPVGMETLQSFGLSNSRMTHETIMCPEARVARVTKSGTKPPCSYQVLSEYLRSILAGIVVWYLAMNMPTTKYWLFSTALLRKRVGEELAV
jgi:hypothetical protein